jgi:4-hydroxybenzoate decarboxylase subunit C
MDTLDYAGPKVNEGSQGHPGRPRREPKRDLPREFAGPLPSGAREAAVFCGGAICVSGPSFREDRDFAARLARDPAVAAWPLVALVDDAAAAAKDARSFLWHVFTRFEPGADVHAAKAEVARNQVARSAPIVLDARMKPWMPGVVEPDPATVSLVDRRWRDYFPAGGNRSAL